ncbi:tRNA (adenosine(37)-N6)-dimethylallyltransferase MiaA [Candidatus Dojkabacteria bacterium]|nr:tRNA (adenosine(37)-N6)-dimethylallyltransferase MiaA [Candidatus Dojkabacteria bacterium]
MIPQIFQRKHLQPTKNNPGKIKIIAISGPTGSGKTDFSINIAKRFNGEIINTDSRQIYIGLDIGTAKEKIDKSIDATTKVIRNIPHHLIDFLQPDQNYSVADFQKDAFNHIRKIYNKNKVPILVGGTGLYTDSIINGYSLQSRKIDSLTFNEQRKQLQSLNVNELQKKIKSINPAKFNDMNPSDQKNPRRLIRIIEKELDKDTETQSEISESPELEVLHFAIAPEKDNIEEYLKQRIDSFFEKGLEKENITLRKKGFNTNIQALQTIGYKEFDRYFSNEIDKDELKQLILIHTRQYVKRQLTWLKKRNEIIWIHKNKEEYNLINYIPQETLVQIEEFLDKQTTDSQ